MANARGLLRLTYFSAARKRSPLEKMVYARHGCDLMGCKSPVCEPWYCHLTEPQLLAEGKGVPARGRLKAKRSGRLAAGESDRRERPTRSAKL